MLPLDPSDDSTSNVPFSPISTLLEELLIIIFDDVITSESTSCHCQRAPNGRWLTSPRRLASISKAWRAIVFACPMLWRHVHLVPAQLIDALKEQLHLSSPVSVCLTVHQWPFRNVITASGPFSIVALTAQLQSILSSADKDGTTLAPASQRVESITINATESSTFLNFVLQTWTGRGSKFPALRHVAMNGNVAATWSRPCFFDGRNAPQLERLELSNVVIAHNAHRLPWGIGLHLTTLVWSAPVHNRGSLVVSVACFHHVVSSFPNLHTLALHEHVVALEFVSPGNLAESGLVPLTHVRELQLCGRVFPNPSAALVLFHLFPVLRRLAVRGRACSGPRGLRTVAHAMQALILVPNPFGWPVLLPHLEDISLDCVDGGEWETWCVAQLEKWREWRETTANAERNGGRVRMQLLIDVKEEWEDTDEEDVEVYGIA